MKISLSVAFAAAALLSLPALAQREMQKEQQQSDACKTAKSFAQKSYAHLSADKVKQATRLEEKEACGIDMTKQEKQELETLRNERDQKTNSDYQPAYEQKGCKDLQVAVSKDSTGVVVVCDGQTHHFYQREGKFSQPDGGVVEEARSRAGLPGGYKERPERDSSNKDK
jgi:Zn-dependent metalloprotease